MGSLSGPSSSRLSKGKVIFLVSMAVLLILIIGIVLVAVRAGQDEQTRSEKKFWHLKLGFGMIFVWAPKPVIWRPHEN